MIAALPMYDWPETQSANDELWQQVANHLRMQGLNVATGLTRDMDLEELWLSPDLLLAQTCSYPLETVLKGKVQYIATPSYNVPGCETAGCYRSVILKRGRKPHANVPHGSGADLPSWLPDACLAFNGLDSMSGYHALARDAALAGRDLPSLQINTGSHRASIIAVANGAADLCAVDCVTWDMALKYEPAAQQVYVAGWTKQRPGLPLITSLGQSKDAMHRLQEAANYVFNAVILAEPTER